MNKMKLFCGMLFLGVLNVGFSQDNSNETKIETLDEVVISDSRFALKRENSGKTVIKITRQEIENNLGKTFTELINTKSGIEINGSRSVAGQNLNTIVRGGNNRQILVVIDGVQVNDPSLPNNEFDLRLIDLNTIESIEILKGAASTLYGNAAATAVINITTKKSSDKKIAASFLSNIGTNQSQNDSNYSIENLNNQISVNGSLNKFNYLASFGNQFAEGLSAANVENAERDPFSRFNTNLKLGYEFSDNFSVSAFGSYDKFKTDIDGFPPPTFAFSDVIGNSFNSEQKRIGLSSTYKYGKGSIQINAAHTDVERENITPTLTTTFEAETYSIDVFNKYAFNENFRAIVGLNYGDYETVFATDESYNSVDPYINAVYISSFGFNLNVGGRLNNHSEYGSQFVYNINPSYRLNLKEGYLKGFGSYATSFIAPNLSQLFGFFGPNPDLEPEENTTIEGGLEYNTNKGIRVNGLYFNRNEENTIIFTTGYENATEDATVHGVEIEAEFNLYKNLKLSTNYTFTEVKDGTRFRVPKHKVNANLGYNFSAKTYASISYQYVGERLEPNFSTFMNENLSAFSLFDVYFSHTIINNKLKLFCNITNLFNEDYTEQLNYTTRGRNVNLGFNLSL